MQNPSTSFAPIGDLPKDFRCQVCTAASVGNAENDLSKVGNHFPSSPKVCEACKKFFKRNINREAQLTCRKGQKSCLKIGNARQAIVSSAGSLYRQICPRCRLDKCISLGMRETGEKSQKSACREVVLIAGPTNVRYCIMENALQKAVKAAEFLIMTVSALCWCQKFPQDPLKEEFPTDVQFWRVLSDNILRVLQALAGFLKLLPGYNNLPAAKRKIMFGNSITKLSASATSRVFPRLCNMNTHYLNQMKLPSEALALWSTMMNWNPSIEEYALLLCLIFYQSDPEVAADPAFSAMCSDLKGGVYALLAKRNPKCNNFDHLMNVSRALDEACMSQVAASTALITRRLDLVMGDPMISELIQYLPKPSQ